MGYDVYIATFDYGEFYDITCFKSTNFNEACNFEENCNFIEEYDGMSRIYIKRK